MVLGQPIFLLAFPLALVLIFVLERWRRRPVLLEVADVSLFVVSPEAEAEARAQIQRLSQAFWFRVAAAAAFSFALSAPRLTVGPKGALEVDLVLERGLLAGAPNPAKAGAAASLADEKERHAPHLAVPKDPGNSSRALRAP